MTTAARPTLIRIRCQSCNVQFNVDARHAGKSGVCPNSHCQQPYQVPRAGVRVKVAADPGKKTTGRPSSTAAKPTKPGRSATNRSPRRGGESTASPASTRASVSTGRQDGSSVRRRRAVQTNPRAEQTSSTSASAASPPRRAPQAAFPVQTAAARRGRTRRRPARSQVSSRWVMAGGTLAAILVAALFLSRNTETPPAATPTVAAANATFVSNPAEKNQAGEGVIVREESPAKPEVFHKTVKPFLEKYCFDCHANGVEEGGLAFDTAESPDDILKQREKWERGLKMMAAGVMPPGDHDPRPADREREAVVDWLDAKLYHVNCGLPHDPGRVTLRRLNRAEYNNTIRDLVGVDFEPAADFPSDEVGYGFDNIGDVLSLPPLLFEKYISAAEEISQRAIVGNPNRQLEKQFAGNALRKSGGASNLDGQGFVSMASTGSVYQLFDVPADGEYTVEIEARADQAGNEPARVELRINNNVVHTFDTKGRRPQKLQRKIKLKDGRQKVEAAFINDYYNPKARNRNDRDRNLFVRSIRVTGPHNFSPASLPETHRRIITQRPASGQSFQQAAAAVLRPFMTRAFRRPVKDEEVERFLLLIELAEKRGDTFEQAIQLAVQGVLVSPHFLFRVELQPQPDNPRQTHRLGDYEIASRLSYFLWSSMPDEQLFQLASEGKLQSDDVLQQQVQRMLADPKADAMVENFATQWLNLRNLDELTPDPQAFPEFNNRLRDDMQEESKRFFASVMRGNGRILDFLDGKYTFVNSRLARLYGIDGVNGEEFRRVSLEGKPRAGVLTQASILTLTSNPGRTSPVKRGKWIMENILGTPPPPAPMGVPELEETIKKSSESLSLREQMELHRENPACASCHTSMDAIGFGFENFNAIGKWRDRDGKAKIDPSGELPGSGSFSGPMELVQILKSRDHQFRRAFVEKMLTYALGRGLEYYDRCTIDELTDRVKQNGDRFHTVITEIVLSEVFRQRRGDKPNKL